MSLGITHANITPNLWLSRAPRSARSAALLDARADGLGSTRATTRLALLRAHGLGRAAQPFNSALWGQLSLYTGSPYALSHRSQGLNSFDDLGPNNSAVTKELQKRLSAYAGRSAALSLLPHAGTASKATDNGLVVFNFANRSSRTLASLSASTAFLPSVQRVYGLGAPLAVGAAQSPELTAAANQ